MMTHPTDTLALDNIEALEKKDAAGQLTLEDRQLRHSYYLALRDEIKRLKGALTQIRDQFENADMTHEEFRVMACIVADKETGDEYAKSAERFMSSAISIVENRGGKAEGESA